MVLDQSRQRLYLVNQSANRVDILSTTTNSLIGNIPVGNGPLAAAISMDSRYLYVTNATSSTVSVIDLNAGSLGGVIQTVSGLAAPPQGVEVGADGRALISLGTTTATTTNSLVILDITQAAANQLTAVTTPPRPPHRRLFLPLP